MFNQITCSGGRADSDRSQATETVSLLNLAVAEIRETMMEGDYSVSTLTDLFVSMMGDIRFVRMAADIRSDREKKASITGNCEELSQKIETVVVGFRYHDRISRRIDHVCHSLALMAKLIADPHKPTNHHEWTGLRKMIKSECHVEADRRLSDVVNGTDPEEITDVEWLAY